MTTDPNDLNGHSSRSGFRSDRTIEDEGRAFAAEVLDALAEGRINDEYGYGTTYRRCREITLAGGGPGADLLLVYDDDGDVSDAFISYYEMGGTTAVRLDRIVGQQLDEALNTAPEW